jgi:hypothetical protein
MNISSWLRLALLCSALICTDLSAQDSTAPQYDVELIVFRNLNARPTQEDWAAEESTATRGKPVVEDNADAQSGAMLTDSPSLQTLPAEQLKLTALVGHLRASRNYRVLSHLGWTQSAVPTRSELSTSLTPLLGDAGVSGSAKLSRGALLHLSLDLRLKDETGASYALQETRQIKLGEKHYFDHPYFGVIATVTPHR